MTVAVAHQWVQMPVRCSDTTGPYEGELGDNSLLELQAVLEQFIDVARDTSGRRYNRDRESVDQSLLRSWATASGPNVTNKGRVLGWSMDKFLDAQRAQREAEAAGIAELVRWRRSRGRGCRRRACRRNRRGGSVETTEAEAATFEAETKTAAVEPKRTRRAS